MRRALRVRSVRRREVGAATWGGILPDPVCPVSGPGGEAQAARVGPAAKLWPLERACDQHRCGTQCGVSQSPCRLSSPARPRAGSPRAPRRRCARRRGAGLPPERRRAGAEDRRGAGDRPRRAGHHQPVPRRAAARRPDRRPRRRLRGRADRHGQRPQWGARLAEALRAGLAEGLLLFEVDPPPFSEGGGADRGDRVRGRGHPSARLDVAAAPRRASATSWPSATGGSAASTPMWDMTTFIRRRGGGPDRRGRGAPRRPRTWDRAGARGGARVAARAPEHDRPVLRQQPDRVGRLPRRARLGRRIPEICRSWVPATRHRPGARPAAHDRRRDPPELGRIAFEVLGELSPATPADRTSGSAGVRGSTRHRAARQPSTPRRTVPRRVCSDAACGATVGRRGHALRGAPLARICIIRSTLKRMTDLVVATLADSSAACAPPRGADASDTSGSPSSPTPGPGAEARLATARAATRPRRATFRSRRTSPSSCPSPPGSPRRVHHDRRLRPRGIRRDRATRQRVRFVSR